MKKIFLLLTACVMMIPVMAQETETATEATEEKPTVEEVPAVAEATEEPELTEAPDSPSYADTVNILDKLEVIETPDNTRVTLGENEVLIVEENGDTVRVVLGSRGISIVEGENGTEIKMMDMDEVAEKKHRKRKKKFRPHYAGFELGLSNYLTPDWSLVLPPEHQFMNLNSGRSWNWNINVVDLGIGLGTSYAGLATGLGFEFTYFNFEGQNSIMKDPNTGEIVEYVPLYAGNISKSRLHTTHITVPLLLEFQIPVSGRGRIYISGGVMGTAKLCSNTKTIYRASGERSKERTRSDFNLSPFRWGYTLRAGYRNFGLYANYYMTTLFKPGAGPELHPLSVGLAFTW